jgi:predicted MPP superfamily phosphohydrolase
MKIGFIFIAFAIFLTSISYVILRGWQALPSVSSIRLIYLVVSILLFLTMLTGMIFINTLPQVVAKTVSFIGYSYAVIFCYLFISFLIVDFVRIINYFIRFSPEGMAGFRMWAMFVTLAITGIAMIIGNYKFNHPAIVNLNLSTDKPNHHKVLKIVAVSDIHLGISIDKKRLQSYVKLMNEQHPDIVLLAGDVSDRSIVPLINQNMAEEFRSIKAPLGIYAINGNHEHYAETQNATADYLKKTGIKFLHDEVCLVDSSFYIIGRDDRSNLNRKNLKEIVNGLDEKYPKILVDHQPFNLEEAQQNGIDLQLSGHTHNGQFFPINLMVKHIYELGYGYLKKGKTQYYVSSGLGLWGPQYRIGTQSELVVINLTY